MATVENTSHNNSFSYYVTKMNLGQLWVSHFQQLYQKIRWPTLLTSFTRVNKMLSYRRETALQGAL